MVFLHVNLQQPAYRCVNLIYRCCHFSGLVQDNDVPILDPAYRALPFSYLVYFLSISCFEEVLFCLLFL